MDFVVKHKRHIEYEKQNKNDALECFWFKKFA